MTNQTQMLWLGLLAKVESGNFWRLTRGPIRYWRAQGRRRS